MSDFDDGHSPGNLFQKVYVGRYCAAGKAGFGWATSIGSERQVLL